MANTFLTPDVILGALLPALEREIVLPRLVWRGAESAFVGEVGDTVNVRVQAIATARTRTLRDHSAAITYDDLTETSVPVELTDDVYHATRITDEELTLDLVDFTAQVTIPQVRAVAEKMEDVIAGALSGGTYAASVDFAEGTDNPASVALACRKALNKAKVPKANRTIVCGADVEAAILNDPLMQRVDTSGTDSALRDAVVGRLAGFTIVSSLAIPDDEAYALHQSAVAFANVAPLVPTGATAGAMLSSESLAMRWIRDYDPDYLRDRALINAYCGAALVEDDGDVLRAVKINFTGA